MMDRWNEEVRRRVDMREKRSGKADWMAFNLFEHVLYMSEERSTKILYEVEGRRDGGRPCPE